MQDSAARRWLGYLGLTRLSAISVFGFFLLCIVVQYFLPKGETLFHHPFEDWGAPSVFALLTIMYAVTQEVRRPKVLVSERRYWVEYKHLMVAAVLYFTFFKSFCFSKSLIPVINPYYLDPWLQQLDTTLHFGVLPTQWAMRLLPPGTLHVIDYLYLSSWGAVMGFYFYWQLLSRPSYERTLFLSSFVMLWLLAGLVAATAFSSVGPIYYSEFFHDGRTAMNAELTRYLLDNKLQYGGPHDLNAYQMLLNFYYGNTITNYNGISSMPSLHTGVAMLIAVHSWFYFRKFAYIAVPFAIVIFFGSFALGWHYAIDTYVSALLLWFVWRLNRAELRRDAAAIAARPSSE